MVQSNAGMYDYSQIERYLDDFVNYEVLPGFDFATAASTAGIAPMGPVVFEEVGEAPRDSTDYVRDQAVPVVVGDVYVIRTHQATNNFGQLCIFYAKMEPLVADVDEGVLEFLIDQNPICNDRTLIAPGS